MHTCLNIYTYAQVWLRYVTTNKCCIRVTAYLLLDYGTREINIGLSPKHLMRERISISLYFFYSGF